MTRAALAEHPIFDVAQRLAALLNLEPKIGGGDEGAEDELAYIQIAQYLFVPLEYPSYRIDQLVYDHGHRECPPSWDVSEGCVISNETWVEGLNEIITDVYDDGLNAVLEGRDGAGKPVEPFCDAQGYDPMSNGGEGS
jgi:hypothetical protein